VVVDEQLDRARDHSLLARAAFRLLTFYDRSPHCPVEMLPPGATDVMEEQVSRFYYSLRFRMPGARPPAVSQGATR
jgi:phytoene/squalene synthetase